MRTPPRACGGSAGCTSSRVAVGERPGPTRRLPISLPLPPQCCRGRRRRGWTGSRRCRRAGRGPRRGRAVGRGPYQGAAPAAVAGARPVGPAPASRAAPRQGSARPPRTRRACGLRRGCRGSPRATTGRPRAVAGRRGRARGSRVCRTNRQRHVPPAAGFQQRRSPAGELDGGAAHTGNGGQNRGANNRRYRHLHAAAGARRRPAVTAWG
jgi:hypothetical protein